MLRALGALVCACSLAAPVSAQLVVGSEFRVNSGTTGSQYTPRIAVSAGGRFMAVWSDRASNPVPATVRGRVFDAVGAPLGADFEIATYTTGQFGSYPPSHPDVAVDGLGNYVVVWDRPRAGFPHNSEVYARRFDMFGASLGDSFVVSADSSTQQYGAAAAADDYGNFIVTWTGADLPGEGIFAARFGSSGGPQGDVFRVNSTTTGDQTNPSVAMERTSGRFMVVWRDSAADGNAGGIYGQQYNGNGTASAGEFRVNTTTTGDDSLPRVSAAENGFVAVWYRVSGGNDLVFARRYSDFSGGLPLGPEVQVASGLGFGSPGKLGPGVAADREGDFVVAWSRAGYGGLYPTGQLVFARRYSVTGAVIDGGFLVNTNTTSNNAYPAVGAAVGSGNFVVAWESYRYGASSRFDVFAQRYGPIAHFGDANGDGQLDVGDVFYLINYLFAGGPAPIGPPDVNGDGKVDVADVFYLINFLFAGGPPPV
jgi:hypothetical protein